MDVMKMKRERQGVIGEMRTLLDTAVDQGNRALTSVEETRFKELEAECDRRQTDIQRAERTLSLAAETAGDVKAAPEARDYKDFGEFLLEVRFNPSSARLHQRAVTTMGDGPGVGYMVPQQFDFTLRAVTPQEAVVRPRATVIPAGDPPDSKITLVALDQSGAKGVYSGVTVNWVGELGPRLTAGNPSVRQIELEPKEVSGWIDVSDKLLRNSAAAGELVSRLLRQAIIAAEEDAFISGPAGASTGKPRGFLNSPATLALGRQTVGQITYDDIINMYARRMRGSGYVWLANQTISPALMKIKDTAGNLIWQPSARDGAPGTLLGLPLVENERQPAIGAKGDLMLVDLSYYAIKDGSPLSIFIDPFTQKVNATTRIYAWWNVDGQALLNTPITLEDKVTTVSPFVALSAATV
jgi:HK97 family phage major capsid protein